MAAKASPELLARTFDLKSAYRQVGLSPDGRNYSCLKVFDPSVGKVRLFRSVVLPFGAIRSVHSFLRLSRAIWWRGTVGCQFVWTFFMMLSVSVNPVLQTILRWLSARSSNCWTGHLQSRGTSACLPRKCARPWGLPSNWTDLCYSFCLQHVEPSGGAMCRSDFGAGNRLF